MFYCGISSNTSTPPPPPGQQSLLSSWGAARISIELAKMSFIKFCLLVAITMVGIKCKNTANLIILLAESCVDIFLSFPAVHTSATRSGVKTRLGYHWLERRASSGVWQMKVLRNRDNRHTHQGKGSGQLDRLSGSIQYLHIDYWPLYIYIDHWKVNYCP